MKTAHALIPKFTVINENHDHKAHATEGIQGEQTTAAFSADLALGPTKRAIAKVYLKSLIVNI